MREREGADGGLPVVEPVGFRQAQPPPLQPAARQTVWCAGCSSYTGVASPSSRATDFFTMQPGETADPLPPGPVLCTGAAGMRAFTDSSCGRMARRQGVQGALLLHAAVASNPYRLVAGLAGCSDAGRVLPLLRV